MGYGQCLSLDNVVNGFKVLNHISPIAMVDSEWRHNPSFQTVAIVSQGYVSKCIVMPINTAKLRTHRATKKEPAKFFFINSGDNNKEYPQVRIWSDAAWCSHKMSSDYSTVASLYIQ